jgi:hypothetical protein
MEKKIPKEENISILMADLYGYTALTETHGAVSAADMIDKYIYIVEDCLVGNCHLKERTGDQVMIVSALPDFSFYSSDDHKEYLKGRKLSAGPWWTSLMKHLKKKL